DRMTKFPGHGLPENGSFQFVEHEFMTPDDYGPFLNDPADWSIRTYLPRAFEKLEGLAALPPLAMAPFVTYNLLNRVPPTRPPARGCGRALGPAGEGEARSGPWPGALERRMAEVGFAPPPLAGSLIEAPFDFMSDTLRGMRGVMTDMLRRPEQLLAAEERAL